MKYYKLSTEVIGDPLGRGYSGMSDQQVADSLNTRDRTVNINSLSGDQVFEATDTGEWTALTDTQRQMWLAFCGRSEIDPFGSANVAFVQWLFGGGSATVSNLSALRTTTISRAEELGLLGHSTEVGPAHIEKVRA